MHHDVNCQDGRVVMHFDYQSRDQGSIPGQDTVKLVTLWRPIDVIWSLHIYVHRRQEEEEERKKEKERRRKRRERKKERKKKKKKRKKEKERRWKKEEEGGGGGEEEGEGGGGEEEEEEEEEEVIPWRHELRFDNGPESRQIYDHRRQFLTSSKPNKMT